MCHLGSPEQRRSPELSPPTPSACGLHRPRGRSDQDFSSDLLRRQVWRGEGQSPARLLVQIRLMPLAEAPPHPAKPRGLGSRCRRRRRDPRAAERAYSDNWGVKRSNHGRRQQRTPPPAPTYRTRCSCGLPNQGRSICLHDDPIEIICSPNPGSLSRKTRRSTISSSP
jgi:hypothetical protein